MQPQSKPNICKTAKKQNSSNVNSNDSKTATKFTRTNKKPGDKLDKPERVNKFEATSVKNINNNKRTNSLSCNINKKLNLNSSNNNNFKTKKTLIENKSLINTSRTLTSSNTNSVDLKYCPRVHDAKKMKKV